jgi:hypothetical protein
MKEKWTNKEEKVWFMEAQKWTQHSSLSFEDIWRKKEAKWHFYF